MASQQKAKRETGQRNSDRRSGKAFSRYSPRSNSVPVTRDDDGKIVAFGTSYNENGVRLHGKGKPSGKSVVGISLKRVEKMAAKQNKTLDEMKKILIELRNEKRDFKKTARREPKAMARISMAQRP